MKFNESKYCFFAVRLVLAASIGGLHGCGGTSDASAEEGPSGGSDATVTIQTDSKPSDVVAPQPKPKPQLAPMVVLKSPVDDSSFEAGEAVLIEAEATDGDGSIVRVDFYSDGSLLGRDTSYPYTYRWSGAPGDHEIYAIAMDDDSITTQSESHLISVTSAVVIAPPLVPPAIELTSPVNGSSFSPGSDITMAAEAFDNDGRVVRVDFYSDGALVGSDAAAPYTFTWPGAVGNHDIHAVAVDNDNLTASSSTHFMSIVEEDKGSVVTYPVTSEIKARFKSTRFAVYLTQNGSTSKPFVYEDANTADPGWSGTLDYMQEANHWTTFSLDGSVSVQAQRLDRKNIDTCIVRPLALGIKTQIDGYKCNFTLTKPVKVSVEIDENYEITQHISNTGQITKHIVKHPLFVFADPLETDIPSASDPGVVYFGPGIHEIGKKYSIPNNTHVYIAGGAYVIGNLISEQTSPNNITISGRGILSGHSLTETTAEHSSWGNHAIDLSKGSKGSGLLIEGITVTNPLRSCIVSYNQVDIRNVKLFSWQHRNDGIVAGNNSVIEKNFIKVMDDNFKLYYSNQIIRDNVIWQQTTGAVFKFAWNLAGVAQNNLVSNIDVIHSDVFTDYPAYEPDRPDMQGKSAVFSAMGFKKGAAFQNNTFEDIRIEERHLLRLMSLRMVTTHVLPSGQTTVWGDPDSDASKLINNVAFRNVEIAGVPQIKSTLYGNAGGRIRNIAFSNLRVNDAKITSRSQFTSRVDGIGLELDGDVAGVSFE